MFPLGNVVFPGELVPLRVFEPRYRRLVLDCLARPDGAEFGTALIERGHEVGGGDQRSSIATLVGIRTVAPLEGGQFNLVTLGRSRLSVLEWLPDDPYPVADVEEWPDALPDSDDAAAAARDLLHPLSDRVRTVSDLTAQLRGRSGRRPQPLKLSSDLVVASYQLAAAVPLGPADRFRVLQAPTVAARLAGLQTAIDDVEAVLRFRLGRAAEPE